METKELKPTFSLRLQSRMAQQSAPLWLRNADLARTGDAGGEGGIQAEARVHDPEAIRPDEPHGAAPREQSPLEFNAGLADFPEACGNHNRAAHTRGGAIGDDRRHRGGRGQSRRRGRPCLGFP